MRRLNELENVWRRIGNQLFLVVKEVERQEVVGKTTNLEGT